MDTQSIFQVCVDALKEQRMLETGDVVVWTAGSSLFVPGTTNLIEIRRID
jgi:pyruvate kinase